MDVLTSGIASAGDIFGGFWSFATGNILVMIPMLLGLVGAGIGIFNWIKGRLTGRKKAGKKKGR